MRKSIAYLSDCQRHQKSLERLNCQPITYVTPPIYKSPPMAKWFLATYIRDVWSRLSYLKASITSVYGAILKIDSTKKLRENYKGQLRILSRGVPTLVMKMEKSCFHFLLRLKALQIWVKWQKDSWLVMSKHKKHPQECCTPTVIVADQITSQNFSCCLTNERTWS